MTQTGKAELPLSDKKKAGLKKSDFIFARISDQELTKLPGSIEGQAFQMDSLINCRVWLLDYCGQVSIRHEG